MKLGKYRESRLATVFIMSAAAVSAGCATAPNAGPNTGLSDPATWSSGNSTGNDHGGYGHY